jgi:hypothetical protein
MIPMLDFIRPISALAFAGACWIGETVTPEIPGVPTWVTSLGFPVAMLIAVIYALVSTNKSLRASEAGRLADRDAYVGKLEAEGRLATESRERLIHATLEQTHEFRRLANTIENRRQP